MSFFKNGFENLKKGFGKTPNGDFVSGKVSVASENRRKCGMSGCFGSKTRMRRRLCSEIMVLKDVFLIKVVIRCVVFESKEKPLKGFRIRFLAGGNLKFFENPL